jgi:hypothetical protein
MNSKRSFPPPAHSLFAICKYPKNEEKYKLEIKVSHPIRISLTGVGIGAGTVATSSTNSSGSTFIRKGPRPPQRCILRLCAAVLGGRIATSYKDLGN